MKFTTITLYAALALANEHFTLDVFVATDQKTPEQFTYRSDLYQLLSADLSQSSAGFEENLVQGIEGAPQGIKELRLTDQGRLVVKKDPVTSEYTLAFEASIDKDTEFQVLYFSAPSGSEEPIQLFTQHNDSGEFVELKANMDHGALVLNEGKKQLVFSSEAEEVDHELTQVDSFQLLHHEYLPVHIYRRVSSSANAPSTEATPSEIVTVSDPVSDVIAKNESHTNELDPDVADLESDQSTKDADQENIQKTETAGEDYQAPEDTGSANIKSIEGANRGWDA